MTLLDLLTARATIERLIKRSMLQTPSRSAYPFADRESRGGTGEFLPSGVAPSHCERSA